MVRATFGTVVMADLDNLKRANDRYGHAVGDRLIRLCAEVLRATLRPYDKLYRWGGDEFLLVLPSAHASDVLARLQRNLDNADPVVAGSDGHAGSAPREPGRRGLRSSEELSNGDRAGRPRDVRREGSTKSNSQIRGAPGTNRVRVEFDEMHRAGTAERSLILAGCGSSGEGERD